MEITEIINQFLMPLVVAGCFALGSALKKQSFSKTNIFHWLC